MLARYRKSGTKEFSFGNISIVIDSEKWTPIADVRMFMAIAGHKKVFDTVQFFDYRPLVPMAKKIWVEGNLVKTKDKITSERMKKIQFLKLQAVVHDKGLYIFRIINYDNRDFRVFDKVGKVLNVFIHRSKGGIGDVIMTTPVVEAVKKKYPNSKVTYATMRDFVPLLKHNPFIDEVVQLKAKATQHDYDIVVDLTTDCIKYELAKKMEVDLNRPSIFVKSCGLTFDHTPAPKIFLSRDEIYRAKDELHRFDGLKIGLVLTSCAPVRRWGGFTELRKALLKKYPTAHILEISETKPEGWKNEKGVHGIFDRTIRHVAALLNECDVVVAPDTGPAHIASALRVPTVWLFTHIDGKVRTEGYKDAVVIQNVPHDCPSKGVPCWYEIPCSKVDNVSMNELRENPPCSKSITTPMVMGEVDKILSKPNISYVVVYHNQDPVVRECVKRIMTYKRHNDEVVLVDNGSENDFSTVFKDGMYKGIALLHRNEENLGCIIARNQGLKMASGKYIIFLDSDQYISQESVHLLSVTEGDLVGVEPWSMDNAGLAHSLKDGKGRLAYVGAGGLIAEREVLNELGGFDEDYSPAWFEDPDICFRARQKGYTIGFYENAGIIHLGHRTVNNQNTFNWKEAWDHSHRIFLSRWKKWLAIRFIRLIVDVPGWAWDNKAQQIKQYLEDDYDIDIEYQSGEVKSRWGDELYFTFECNDLMLTRVDARRPYITGVTAHTYQNMNKYKESLRGALATHANSRLLYEEILEHNKNCYYLPNGVDEDLFRYSQRDIEREFTVGYVGKAHERKGVSSFIIPACDKAGVKLVMQACKYKDSNKINHLRMPGFYHDIDVVLIASDMDGTPNQLLEAASVGRTFIGNRIGNVPEFVDEGVNGFMVEREVDAYVEKILWLRDHRDECKMMGIEARRTVERDWTWRIQAERYREMFQRCM